MTTSPTVLLLGEAACSERPGGLNRYFEDLHRALCASGHPPAAALVLGPGGGVPDGVTTTSDVERPLLERVLAYRRAASRLGSSAQLVDAHFALYALLPVFTTRLRRLPLVVHFQGPWADESALSGERTWSVHAKRAIERMVYRRAERIVVLSDDFGQIVTERYGVDKNRVMVLAPGVDLERFVPGDVRSARARLHLPESAFVAVTARRLERRMGLDTMLSAWKHVERSVPGAVLVIAGDGPERQRLEALRAELARPDAVRILGRVTDDELVSLYQAADCSVVPTRALEGFGLVALESVACGTPAIVTRVGGLPDAITALDSSLVVEPDDPAGLAARVEAAACGQLPRRAACRAHAERFGWEGIAARHVDLYSEVAGETPRRPRIVFLDHCAQLSGGELALVRLLATLDVDAHVILAEDGPLAERLEAVGATVEILPMAEAARGLGREAVRPSRLPAASMFATVGYTARVARRLRQLRPDGIHTNSLKAALYGGFAGRLTGVPVIWHLRDRISDDHLPLPAVKAVRSLARLLPAAVIADTASTLDTLRSPPVPCAVIPSALAVRDQPFGGAARQPSVGLTVGMVGRLAPWKGQHVFLDAFARAFPDGSEQAVIVGDALFGHGEVEYATSLRARAETLGIGDRVTFTGQVDDVDTWYERFDVLVHASTTPEPFGQVIVEAMAHGLAVVAPDAGGPAEIITDEVDGLLFPPGDVRALADRLDRLAVDPELRDRLGNEARRRADAFAPEVASERLLALYQLVLKPPLGLGRRRRLRGTRPAENRLAGLDFRPPRAGGTMSPARTFEEDPRS